MLHTTANPAEPTQSTVLADYCSRHGLLLSHFCAHAHAPTDTQTHTSTPQASENTHTMNCLCGKLGLLLLWHLEAFFVSAIRLPWLCNLGWQVFPKSFWEHSLCVSLYARVYVFTRLFVWSWRCSFTMAHVLALFVLKVLHIRYDPLQLFPRQSSKEK